MLAERLREIRAELDAFDDEFTKYSFLVELSAYVSPDQPDLMVDENLQSGCQSQVWLALDAHDGVFSMRATSDTLIIRGILYIMQELFNGVPLEEIAQSDIDFLDELGIAEHFSDTRQLGIRSIASSIVSFCRDSRGTGAGA
jgi:cysteine desulfuration protein SufE